MLKSETPKIGEENGNLEDDDGTSNRVYKVLAQTQPSFDDFDDIVKTVLEGDFSRDMLIYILENFTLAKKTSDVSTIEYLEKYIFKLDKLTEIFSPGIYEGGKNPDEKLSTIVNRLRALIFSFVDKVNKDPLFVKYKESSLTFWDEIQENRQINWVQGSLIWEEEREKLSPYMYALTTLMTENYHDIVSGVIYRDTDDKHYKLFKETLITLTRISKTPYPF